MTDLTPGALAPLHNRDFRFLLAGFAIGQMLMPLQFITQILWVQSTAPNNIWLILVAFIATSRGLGGLAFGLYGGALADRFNRKHLLQLILGLQVLTTSAIAGFMYLNLTGFVGFGAFFILTFLSSGLQSIDAPTRLAIVPDVLGQRLTPSGISLNQVSGQIAMPVAIMVTGIMIDQFGFSGAYGTTVIGYLLAMILIGMMRYAPSAQVQSQQSQPYGLAQIKTDISVGLRYARGEPVILWVIILLILLMSLGYPATASLGPTWVTTEVGVAIPRMGFVMMFWGIGSFIAALMLARFANFVHRGALIAFGALLFSLSFVIFVLGKNELNIMIGNFGLGAGMTTMMVSSTILIQHIAPSDMRGRIMSIFQLNMAFAQLMTMPIALLAQWMGLAALFPILSYLTVAMVVWVLFRQPQLIRATIRQTSG